MNKTSFNAGIGNYTVEVLNSASSVVNSSQQNSHDANRFDCNSCHTATGTNGAPGRIVSFDVANQATSTTSTNTTPPPSSTPTRSFSRDVAPILNGCNSCHTHSFSGSSSSSMQGVIDTNNPSASRILKKGTGAIGHSGGDALGGTSSSAYVTIRDWITQGAQNN